MSEPQVGVEPAAPAGGAAPPTAPAPDATEEPLTLSEEERELVRLEAEAAASRAPATARAAYEALARAAEAGTIAPEILPLLERVVVVSLETGRARARYLAEGEGVLNGVFRRTPLGRALDANVAEINRALGVLTGRPLRGVRLRARAPGHFTLTLDAERIQLTLAVRPHGVVLESVGVLEAGGEHSGVSSGG